jgi:hypothetical protein
MSKILNWHLKYLDNIEYKLTATIVKQLTITGTLGNIEEEKNFE